VSNEVRNNSQGPPYLEEFIASMSHELPGTIRQTLKFSLQTSTQPMENLLEDNFENVVRNAYGVLCSSFMSAAQVPDVLDHLCAVSFATVSSSIL
jgi:hypothetical protein